MANLPAPMPAFCKIIVGDFLSELLIPPALIEKHGKFFRRKVKLQTDDHSGNSWDAKIVKRRGNYWLTDGLQKFVKENGVDFPDFCIFRFVSDTRIMVGIFDKNGCKRTDDHENLSIDSYTSSKECETDPSYNGEKDSNSHHTANENVRFSFVWKKSMKNCMLIRASVCDRVGLKEETLVKVKNWRGLMRTAKLFKNSQKDGRVGLGSGWAPFVFQTKFEEGKAYEIEFIRRRKGELLLQLRLLENLIA